MEGRDCDAVNERALRSGGGRLTRVCEIRGSIFSKRRYARGRPSSRIVYQIPGAVICPKTRWSLVSASASRQVKAAAAGERGMGLGRASVYSRLCVRMLQAIWHMRRAVMAMASLAPLPRARCRR